MFYAIIVILYFFIITIFIIGILLSDNVKIKQEKFSFFSIIIAYRNEEKNILNILNNLISQKYPPNKFEIILIDDNSSDNSYKIINKFILENKNIKILHLKLDKNQGKKNAIYKGVQKSTGELIITTDADCVVGENWLSLFNNLYTNKNPKMIIAPVKYKTTKKLFSFANFQALEFASLIGSTIGAAGINSPIMCNGANLSFQKSVYQEFTDPTNKNITSGDDTFLMFNIKKKYPNIIFYLFDNQAITTTKPSENFKDFYHQRIRWASKSKYYKDGFTIFTGVITLLINTLLFYLFWSSFYFSENLKFFIIAISIKSIVDFILLLSTTRFLKQTKLLLLFPFMQIIYFQYVTLIGLLSFFLKYNWKDRKINK